MRTKWLFKPLKKYKGKKTWVSFTMHSDPGGNIPNWLINMISKVIPRKTIQNIRKMVKTKQYNPAFVEKYKRFKDWY